jgi:Uma2 family endonuclease
MIPSAPALGEYKQTLIDLLPDQGHWSEDEYLWLTDHTSRLVELTDGHLEPLPMPTDSHQSIVGFFYLVLGLVLAPLGGKVQFAPVRLRIRPGKFREPDVLAVRIAKDARRGNRYWNGADLTLEVVSPEKPKRDLVDKRHDYAEANVPEYWIVNPLDETITVLRVENGAYVEHGVFRGGDRATSVILSGFGVNVTEVFDIETPPDEPKDSANEAEAQ